MVEWVLLGPITQHMYGQGLQLKKIIVLYCTEGKTKMELVLEVAEREKT
jgi:hypothetical protein